MAVKKLKKSLVWINVSKSRKELQDIMISIEDELKQQKYYDLKDLYKYVSLDRKFDRLQKAISDIANTKLGISDLTKQDILYIIYWMIMDQIGYTNMQPEYIALDSPPSDHFESFYAFLYPYQIEMYLNNSYYQNTQKLIQQQRNKYDYSVVGVLEGKLNGEHIKSFITVDVKGFETKDKLMDFFINQIQDLKEIEDIKSSRSDDESSRFDFIRLRIYNHNLDLESENEEYEEYTTLTINTIAKFLIKDCSIMRFPVTMDSQCQECNDLSQMSIIPANIFTLEPTYLLIPEPNLWYIFKKLNNNKEHLREFVENHIKASYKILTLFNPKRIHINLFKKPTDNNIWILDTNKGIEIENTIMDTAVMQSIQSIYDRSNLGVDDFAKSKQNEQTQGLTV
ncbi:MAG: hypothetical protein QXV17_11255 [Candidatus Micrarchaeaceae archaeon]